MTDPTRKLSFEQLIGATFAFQHVPFETAAKALADLGFRAVEMWGVAPHLDLFHANAAKVRSVKATLAARGLSLFCFTPEQVVYPINIASGDPELRRASVARFRHAAEITAELGGKYLFLTSGRGFENEPAAVAWERAREAIAEIVAHAEKLGVRCLLEPLQRVETNILLDAAGMRKMLDEVGADTLDVVLDTVGMAVAGDTVDDYVHLFGSRLAHVQIVDGTPAGHLVWGDGTLPLGDMLEGLARHGYAGTLTFEPFGNGSYALDPVETWRRSLAAISPYLGALA